MPEAVAARVAALAGLAGDDEATVVLVRGGDEHGDHGVAQHRGGDALNGGRVGVGDQVAAAASLRSLRAAEARHTARRGIYGGEGRGSMDGRTAHQRHRARTQARQVHRQLAPAPNAS
jgi:hypothetical protein